LDALLKGTYGRSPLSDLVTEVEGLQISLNGARAKLLQLDQLSTPRSPISLGIPTQHDPESKFREQEGLWLSPVVVLH
jgi:hypothetical protein